MLKHTQLNGAWHAVGPVYPSPPHWPHCGMVPEPTGVVEVGPVGGLVAVVAGLVTVVIVVAGGELLAGSPKSLETPAKNPEFAHV